MSTVAGVGLVVVLPLLLMTAYYMFWVSERYVSTTQLIVKENGAEQSVDGTLGMLMPGISGSSQDAHLVVNYIQSLDMALYLDEELELASYYKSDRYDYFSRLETDASREDYLDYYREHIGVSFDEVTGIVSIEVQAFEPEFARKLIQTITRKSEDFVNAVSNELAEKQVNFVRTELDRAQEKLRAAKQEILDFQNQNEVVSPEELTRGISSIIQGLEARLSEQKAKLSASKTYLNAGSSQIVSIETEIAALENQIEQEKARIVGVSGDHTGVRLNSLSANFQNLQLDLQFAMDAYQAALKALETARMEASSRLKHLIVVSRPSMAEEARFPRKIYNLISLAVVLLLIYGVIRMMIASIKDHRI
ncbi:capsular biosynthesis protein [Microbulbifer hydrolyticus]|uniref:Capsular biosynthesis protein n=1 Tax=Microbulbifer hydrolyticus TaxID=48074 RepID=A0A6P1TDR3_9GAMM|nr:capsular biosynthesis protein [Microbulbifer hydrolyticus]MBB5212314.1 capsular polysaccharide transport system permease protein [Microbulbifer hydrolyticus]QHQ39961.1 capsular biosynthesis protein [Microbulbifer hydrolyticus]